MCSMVNLTMFQVPKNKEKKQPASQPAPTLCANLISTSVSCNLFLRFGIYKYFYGFSVSVSVFVIFIYLFFPYLFFVVAWLCVAFLFMACKPAEIGELYANAGRKSEVEKIGE